MSDEKLGWHVISGEDLLRMVRRVADGEDPDLVYVEEYVNADRERVDPDCGSGIDGGTTDAT